jgi:hypothetical protein
MARFVIPFALCFAGPALSGCDGRAGNDYHGESLLSVTGSVHIQNDDAPANLVPALAFRNSKTPEFEIVDVDVKGDFPARFTLDVFTPPPESAIQNVKFPEEPKAAFGYIAAVTPNHPKSIGAPSNTSAVSECYPVSNGDGGTSSAEAGTPPQETCFTESRWCKSSAPGEGDSTACYVEKSECDARLGSCVVTEMTGDPALKSVGFWDTLAGFSRNYVVAYLEKAADPSTFLSYALAGGRPLEAGYHLVHVTPRTPDEVADYRACLDAVVQDVLPDYNRIHGTNFTDPHDAQLGESDILWFNRTAFDYARKRGCKVGDENVNLEAVGPTDRTPVAVEIGTDLVPLFKF